MSLNSLYVDNKESWLVSNNQTFVPLAFQAWFVIIYIDIRGFTGKFINSDGFVEYAVLYSGIPRHAVIWVTMLP